MMFWGDIILKYPKLISELAKLSRSSRRESAQISRSGLTSAATTKIIALAWGYEADHPFEKEAVRFARAKIPFYVCPGTSTWQTLIGRHDNAFANLRAAAKAGKKLGAIGYLNTEWGDGGHPQPLAVSWPLLAAGAALAWNAAGLDEKILASVLSRDVFDDTTGNVARAGMKLGFAHQKLGVKAANETPLGAVIAAPKPEDREMFCRNGLKWFAKIPAKKIRATLNEIEQQRKVLARSRPQSDSAKILARELDLAARMAAQSCKFMLWQQVVAAKKSSEANRLAKQSIWELRKLDEDFNAYWPLRNKGTTKHCSPFLKWRIEELMKNEE